MGEYIVRFVQAHESFRRPELAALARYEHVELDIKDYREQSPFCIVRFGQNLVDATVRSFISRSILSKGIVELWGSGEDYESLHTDIKSRTQHLWSQYSTCSFKFSFDSFCGKRSTSEQKRLINSFSYLGFKGKIAMTNPEVEFIVMEEWDFNPALSHLQPQQNGDDEKSVRAPRRIFLGRLVGTSQRGLAEKHDLKKRPYISTTSMDAELALVTATLALAGPGKLFLDPFAGTGGFMIAASELGALSLGSDIDGRSFRGKGKGIENGIGLNLTKYNLYSLYGDCITSDLTNTPFRVAKSGGWLDGIIADPPYGVREGLRVLGVRSKAGVTSSSESDSATAPRQPAFIDGVLAHTLPDYIPPKKPYSFSAMLDDIMEFAAATLVNGGRLAFWMPSANVGVSAVDDEPGETATEIPSHPCLVLVHVCTQSFNKWSRKLLVYERRADADVNIDAHAGADARQNAHDGARDQRETSGVSADDLNPFRRMYFRGFQA